MNNLEQFQWRVARVLIALSWIQLPILAAMSWMNGKPTLWIFGTALVGASISTYFYRAGRSIAIVGFMLSLSLVSDTSLSVYIYSGHPWQVEMHFYYFVVLAMLSGFVDWRILVVNASVIVAHHLLLNTFFPWAIYPGGGNFLRVVLHASYVAVETGVLVAISFTIRNAFQHSDAALNQAEQSTHELEKVAARREKELSVTAMRADQTGEMLGDFKQEMETSVGVLHNASVELKSYMNELSEAASLADSQSDAASAASEETTRSVNAASGAGEELGRSIGEVGNNAERSSKLAAGAVQQAETTNTTINEMAAVVAEIGQVTGLISSIAAQTNLLALNATIEAARAGEAGRGFAVVAQEVKGLASQTATATQEITSRIEAMQSTTARSVEAIQAITATIKELDQFSAAIAASVEHQASTAQQISSSVTSAGADAENVVKAIEEIRRIAARITDVAKTLSSTSEQVAGQTDDIRNRVSSFADRIQAMQA